MPRHDLFDRTTGRPDNGLRPNAGAQRSLPAAERPAPGLWDHLTDRERGEAPTRPPTRPAGGRPSGALPDRHGPGAPPLRTAPAPLTGLPDRQQLESELHRCARSAAADPWGCALVLLRLDHFERVLDSVGPAGGDRVLVEVAHRLRDSIRSVDMAAHLGGDVFAVLMAGLSSPDRAASMARSITAALGLPIEVDDDFVMVTASVGVALCGPGLHDPEALMARAEAALWRARCRGDRQIECDLDAAP